MFEVKLRFPEVPDEKALRDLLAAARRVDHRKCATWTDDGKSWILMVGAKSRAEGKDAEARIREIADGLGVKYQAMRIVEAVEAEEE